MTTFYISPSSLSYKQYASIYSAAVSFGWSAPWSWSRESFRPDYVIEGHMLSKALLGISRSDIFIAVIPGTCSTLVEIGMAYTLCEKLFIVSKDPVHFTQTGLCDAHLSALPGLSRVCCGIEDIPEKLLKEYLYLVDVASL